MSTQALTSDNQEEVFEGSDIIVIDFWAEWCGPCKNYGPIFEEVSNNPEFNDVSFLKCNTENERELAMSFGIRSIPSTVFIREKIVLDSVSGVVSKEQLETAIKTLKNIDMEEVRKNAE